MPINPSDLPWWGWLLCSLAAWVACFIGAAFRDTEGKTGCLAVVFAYVSGLTGFITGAIALIRFVKWVWDG